MIDHQKTTLTILLSGFVILQRQSKISSIQNMTIFVQEEG